MGIRHALFHWTPSTSLALWSLSALVLVGCDRPAPAVATATAATEASEPSPEFQNVSRKTSYVGDSSCVGCHRVEAAAYRSNSMSQSFHRSTADGRIEPALDSAIVHARTGYAYTVVDSAQQLWQVEFLPGPNGTRRHELRRRIDYVMGSGRVARTYFNEENGRLFQLPLTWYRGHGWDMSPGYDVRNARFDRVLPDQCIACHSSYPEAKPHLEAKFAELRDGIGCERCHGPGALHVQRRSAAAARPSAPAGRDTAFDATIVNPARLPLERRLDVCEQCHVHTTVSVLRQGKNDFSYLPSQPLRDQRAFFKTAGSIDLVSHADRLRQSKCFIASRASAKPLECSTCHEPHGPSALTVGATNAKTVAAARDAPCLSCHAGAALTQRLAQSPALAQHAARTNCVSCHMPKVNDRAVHGAFTDHWVRIIKDSAAPVAPTRTDAATLVPYYERDKSGPEAAIYSAMGAVVNATFNQDPRELGRAADALRSALGSDETHPDAQFLLGATLQQVGRAKEAIPVLERAVRLDSMRPDPLRALAQAYQTAGRAPEKIDRLYQRALASQPALAWIRADYADFLASVGRTADAEREYRAAVSEEPSRASAWFNLGTVLLQERKPSEASSAFQQAVHLDPLLAQALSPLVQLNVAGAEVTGVGALTTLIGAAPLPGRSASAFQLAVTGERHVSFMNVPPRSFVLVLKPDGSLLFALPTGDGPALRWDLMSARKEPIAAGLYRAELRGRDAAGRPLPTQSVYFGIARTAP